MRWSLAVGLLLSLGAPSRAQFVTPNGPQAGGPHDTATGLSHDGTWLVAQDYSSGLVYRWSAATGVQFVPMLEVYIGTPSRIADGGDTVTGLRGKKAVVWTPIGLTVIPGFGLQDPLASLLRGLSADGQVAAGAAPYTVPWWKALRWDAVQGQTELPLSPGALYSHAYAVSADGAWIVGVEYGSTGHRAVRWDANGVVSYLEPAGGTDNAFAYGVNHDGSAVVGSRNSRAFRWTASGGVQWISSEHLSVALAVSDDGETVVGAVNSNWLTGSIDQQPTLGDLDWYWTGSIWRAGMGWRPLGQVLLALGLPLPGAPDEVFHACAISGDGRKVAGSSAWGAFVATLPAWVETYCTAQTNSQGCTPHLVTSGTASATSGAGFQLAAGPVIPNTNGLLIYGTSGAAAQPFNGGTLCVAAPRRTGVQDSGGAAPCSGTFALDFNAFVAAGGDPTLTVGAQVWAQYWSRDPQGVPPAVTNLTDAVTFRLMP